MMNICLKVIGFIFVGTFCFFEQRVYANENPMVGRWVVDFVKTAESLGNDDKAKGLLNAAKGGLRIEMVFEIDGTTQVIKGFGNELDERKGKYKILDNKSGEITIEIKSRFAGLRFEQLYETPDDFVNQPILMIGTFREHYGESESFGLGQGEYVIEVFYEKLNDEQKKAIKKQQNGAETPVAVAGQLGRSSIEDDEVYYIEATGVNWDHEVMGTDILKVKMLEGGFCQMGVGGDDMLLIWKRVP